MKHEAATTIVRLNQQAGLDGVQVYEDYSGRGMYGETTTALQIDEMQSFYTALSIVMEDGDSEDREWVADFLSDGVQWDQLGKGFVIY